MMPTEAQYVIDAMVRADIEARIAAGEIEPGALVICMQADEWEGFEDDLFADCDGCGVRLRYRPYMPKEVERVCVGCAKLYAKGAD
jgi:hypothetical protein